MFGVSSLTALAAHATFANSEAILFGMRRISAKTSLPIPAAHLPRRHLLARLVLAAAPVFASGLFPACRSVAPYDENILPKTGACVDFEVSGKRFSFLVKGVVLPQEVQAISHALSLWPPRLVNRWAYGNPGAEPPLTFYIVNATVEEFGGAAARYEGMLDGERRMVLRRDRLGEHGVNHELAHAASDYMMPGQAETVLDHTVEMFEGTVTEEILAHKRRQVEKFRSDIVSLAPHLRIPMDGYGPLYRGEPKKFDLSDVQLREQLIPFHRNFFVRSVLERYFASPEALIQYPYNEGDPLDKARMAEEYWAESWGRYYFDAERLKRADPVLFHAIEALDARLRRDEFPLREALAELRENLRN